MKLKYCIPCHVFCCFSCVFTLFQPPPHAAVQALARVLLHLQKTCPLAKRLRDSQKPDIDMQQVCFTAIALKSIRVIPSLVPHQALQQVGWSPRSSIEAATMTVQVTSVRALPRSLQANDFSLRFRSSSSMLCPPPTSLCSRSGAARAACRATAQPQTPQIISSRTLEGILRCTVRQL